MDETSMTPDKMVKVRSVRKTFGSKEVLKGVTFDVRRGGSTVIIGPSGSGKSTILRCINFLETFEAGDIYVGDKSVGYQTDGGGNRVLLPDSAILELRQNVGMVFQSFNLFPHKNVIDNITLAPRRIKGMPRNEATDLARSLLDEVGLRDKEHAYPSSLSGGQQQRVAIARALAMQPKVMLFDEVTSALDPELVDEVLRVIKKLAVEGMTMVIVTHEIAFAKDVADQILFFDEGAIQEQGPPDALLAPPYSNRLQTFLNRYIRNM